MTDRYCDLAQDFSNPANVGDTSGNPALGPGGFQSMVEGWGNHDVLAAGDRLFTKGIGDLSKLVKITVDVDKSGTWVISDVVQNFNDGGGASGDDWVGELVFISATILWVQINSASSDIDSVDTADGVDNTTRADQIAGANMTAAAAPGIQIDNNQGTNVNYITLEGVDSSWVQLAAGGGADTTCQAVLDANGKAVNCMLVGDKDYFHLKCFTMQEATNDGLDTDGAGFRDYWQVEHCLFQSNTGHGWNADSDWRFALVRGSVFRSNGVDGVRDLGVDSFFIACGFVDNTGIGINGSTGNICSDCYAEGNGGNQYLPANRSLWIHGVITGGSNSGINMTTAEQSSVFFSRIVNHTVAGKFGISSTARISQIEDWNVFFNNQAGDLNGIPNGGINSYGDDGNHISDPADDGIDANFEVIGGSEHSGTPLVLDWDSGGVTPFYVTAGLSKKPGAPLLVTGGLLSS